MALRRISAVAGVLILGASVAQVSGQPAQPVVEVGQNLVVNGISAANLVIHTAEWAKELLSLGGFVLDEGDWAADLAVLGGMIEEGQELGLDLSNLQSRVLALFDPANVPQNPVEFDERMIEIGQATYAMLRYNMRTQTLVTMALNLLTRLLRLLSNAIEAEGNKQVGQTFNQYLALLNQSQESLRTQSAAHYQASSLKPLEDNMVREYIRIFNQKSMEGGPTTWPFGQ